MKRFFVFLILGVVISTGLAAQNKTRKVPFLPYAGATIDEDVQTKSVAKKGASPAKVASNHKVVLFDKDSSVIRKDQVKNLYNIGKWLEREGGAYYYVYIFTSPEISSDLAKKRGDTVIQSLSDFNVGEPIVQIEHRNAPVINPNRVEVSLRSSTASLGNASSNFGAASSNTSRSNF